MIPRRARAFVARASVRLRAWMAATSLPRYAVMRSVEPRGSREPPRSDWMRRSVLALLLAGVGCASAARTSSAPVAPAAPPVGAVTAEELRRDLYAFADDSMRGRETGTEDANRAMRFLANRVKQLGLEPAGD